MSRAPLTHPAIQALAAALGDDCYIVDDFGSAPEVARNARWTVETDGVVAMIYCHGTSVCLVNSEDRSIRLGLYCRYEGGESLDPKGDAGRWVEEEMLPAWTARGYRDDAAAGNGWDEASGFWQRGIYRTCVSGGELVVEGYWAAHQETTHYIG